METKDQQLKFMDPKEMLIQLDVSPGIVAADFGCGSGYFSIALAQLLGSDGKVFALDVMKQSLESVESRAKLMSLQNVIVQRVNLEKENGSKLESESLDLVIIKDMLFQNQDKKNILAEAARVLKSRGKVLIVEWKKETMGVGPDASLRVSEKDLQKVAEKAGLALDKKIEAGNFHYALVFKK
jgi:ubiquinone/menaquinone biosynthesis C-methylase UbiE